MTRILSTIAFLLFTATLTLGQESNFDPEQHRQVARQILDAALGEQKGYKILGELCEIGPRLSGSENSLKAIRWAKEKMHALGFDRVELQPVMVPHWVRGPIETLTISNGENNGRELAIAALGRSIGTPEEGITAGVIEVKTFDELRAVGDKAHGKIVFLNGQFDPTVTNTFSGYGRAVTHRALGAIETAKAGGVATLIRSVTTRYDNVPHTGSMRPYAAALPKVPGAALGQIDADYLSQAIKENPDLQLTLKLSCKTLPDAQSYNVIADLIGSEKPDEYVLVSGHFDSWDKGCGAHDDGAGCIQALEALDLFKRLNIKPKRTLRCVFYINEENGIKGALEYARVTEEKGINHIAAIESDRGAFTPRGFSVDADSTIIAQMQPWLPILNMASIDYVRKGGSGVDVGQLKTAVSRIGFVPDSQRYFDFHHSANDVYEAVHPREFEMGAAAITILAYLLTEEGLEY